MDGERWWWARLQRQVTTGGKLKWTTFIRDRKRKCEIVKAIFGTRTFVQSTESLWNDWMRNKKIHLRLWWIPAFGFTFAFENPELSHESQSQIIPISQCSLHISHCWTASSRTVSFDICAIRRYRRQMTMLALSTPPTAEHFVWFWFLSKYQPVPFEIANHNNAVDCG